MRSDVPVASFLSGGLDSSVVTITAQRLSSVPMQTFALGFEHTEFDERPYAASVARCAGTDHHELSASVQDAIEQLPLLLWHMDEPIGDSSIIPNFLISRMAASNVKVCLSGLGGDELFGGYSRYMDPGTGRIRRVFQHAPAAAKTLAPRSSDHYNYPWAEELRQPSSPSMAWRSYLHRLRAVRCHALCRILASLPRATPKKRSKLCGINIPARMRSPVASLLTSRPTCRMKFWR